MSEDRIKRQSFFERSMRLLNILAVMALLVSYAGGTVSPETFWPLAFAAMAYPILLGLILLFSFYWMLKRKWFVFLNLALLLLRSDLLFGTIGFSNSDSEGLKVMTYNVRLFDKYNWNNDDSSKDNIVSFLIKENADILCIQEYYDVDDTILRQLTKGGHKNIQLRNYYAQRNNKNDWGIATISRFPMVQKGSIVLENSRSALAIFTDLKIEDDTVRVYNFHLQSIHLGRAGYEIVDGLMENQQMDELSDSKLLAGRLKSGFIKRAIQAEEIAEHIANCPYPVIVCGDFNDVPSSYTYQTISSGLKDSFNESGKGFGFTYVRVPFFRIDNILFSNDFSGSDHTTFSESTDSDHFAVSTRLTLKK